MGEVEKKKANSSMFFSRTWSQPKPETTTLSSHTATGLHDIKKHSFAEETHTEAEGEAGSGWRRNLGRVADLHGYVVLMVGWKIVK